MWSDSAASHGAVRQQDPRHGPNYYSPSSSDAMGVSESESAEARRKSTERSFVHTVVHSCEHYPNLWVQGSLVAAVGRADVDADELFAAMVAGGGIAFVKNL